MAANLQGVQRLWLTDDASLWQFVTQGFQMMIFGGEVAVVSVCHEHDKHFFAIERLFRE